MTQAFWLANPSTYETFISYTSQVWPAAEDEYHYSGSIGRPEVVMGGKVLWVKDSHYWQFACSCP
jgi:hypothetical protein